MKKKLSIYFNAPITLGFVGLCALVLILDFITRGVSTHKLFSTYGFTDPLSFIRLFGHVLGHSGVEHFVNNMLYILLLGPILEEKYHERLIPVILVTAVVTGLVHNIFFPNLALLGASGVVFAFIILASVTGDSEGIPITLILVALLWIGGEIYDGLTAIDNVSQLTHIIGGISGGVMGLLYKRK